MSVAIQASNPASALCRFLDTMLPQRGLVAELWARQAREAPWSAVEVDADRQWLGHAAEMRIGLDLADAPGYWGVLSFLPGDELRSLLLGAGYRPAGYENLADTGTADPLLREWIRSSHPVTPGGAQRAVLAACWDAALAASLVQALDECSVERRRSFLVHVRGLEGDLRAASQHPPNNRTQARPPGATSPLR